MLLVHRDAGADLHVPPEEHTRVAGAMGVVKEGVAQARAEVFEHRLGHGQQLRRRAGGAGGLDEERALAGHEHIGLAGRHALDEGLEPFVGAHRHLLAKLP